MIELRPIGYVIGLLVCALGVMMAVPMLVDLAHGQAHWRVFLQAGVITAGAGGLMALACRNGLGRAMTLRQAFVLTTGIWVMLPLFGTLPLMGPAGALGFTDAYFEAMSGLTTTGATMLHGIDALPPGLNLWRGLLNWLGGLGIVIVAMLFLPVMKLGGMQFFRSEGFDTLGKVLPRAMDISSALIRIYLGMTLLCILAYRMAGLSGFDATMHALSTVSTGGFSSYDFGFAEMEGAPQWVACVFMVAAALPFIRYVQLIQGQARPLWADIQVRAFLRWVGLAVAMIAGWLVLGQGRGLEWSLREATFNVVSVVTGTGYASVDVTAWGPGALVILMVMGLAGGCTASTACSVKVFRWLVVLGTIRVRMRQLYSPRRVQSVRLGGETLPDEVVNSVMAFLSVFIVTFGVLIVALSLTGLDSRTAITAAWTAIANVGPAWGPEVAATGAMHDFPTAAKWLMIFGMLLGRLEILSVLVLFLPRFWRD